MQDWDNMPDKTGMELKRIENEKELLRYNLDALSQDLYKEDTWRLFPIYLVFMNKKLVGYFHVIEQPVVYPALHPDRLTPREFLKVVRSLVTEFKRMTGCPLFMLCNRDTAFGEKNMKRIRLKKAPENAYVYDQDAP